MSFYKSTGDYEIGTSSQGGKMPAMHYHQSYELYYLAMGSREYFIEDKFFTVNAGEFVLIAPGKLHRTGGEYGTRTLVNFTADFLSRHFSAELQDRLLGCFDHMILVPGEEQLRLCSQCLSKMADAREDEQVFALWLGLLLTTLGTCQAEEPKDALVSRIIGYINKNYAAITSLDALAEEFYISKYYLCRIFKNAMKMTVVDYLTQIRIKNARQLLEFSQRDIRDIAQSCGFHSGAYFCNLYRKVTGQTPSAFRKSCQRRK